MKKIFLITMLLCSLCNSTFAQSDKSLEGLEAIDVTCHDIHEPDANEGVHRMPPRVPNIYLDRVNSGIRFDTPCYSTVLEITTPSTGITAYTFNIPDGETTVSLPAWLEGEYELHIHRGNYCFMGIIEL